MNTKLAAEAAERVHIERALKEAASGVPLKKEVPTFDKWFNGRFWTEWVVAKKNKPSEVEAKESIYKVHLKERFGDAKLDEIGVGEVAGFRASLVGKKLSEKRINNILTVLSTPLRYAAEVRLIPPPPKVGLFKVEQPEIVSWELDEYPRILEAAKAEGLDWHVAACLAGEAGLRIGEVRALDWERDIDLKAGALTVNHQMRHGILGTPKGRTRRTIPMTETLIEALRGLSTVRRGSVVRNLDGKPKTDGQTTHAIYRICSRAGLPGRAWHVLRHSFATHAALFGVNAWRLQKWMGHKTLTETMRYVHLVDDHRREIPEHILAAGEGEKDPDRRVLKMLGSRGKPVANANAAQTDKVA